jgi:uncharacterized membrane protein
MRSQLPLALLAVAARRDRAEDGAAAPAGFLGSDRAALGFGLAAVGELVGDKLPFTPSRLDPLPLAGRLGFGGAAGAVVARAAGGPAILGLAAGAAGGLLGAFGGYRARVAAGRATGVPDPVWGAVEDAVAVSIGLLAVRR